MLVMVVSIMLAYINGVYFILAHPALLLLTTVVHVYRLVYCICLLF